MFLTKHSNKFMLFEIELLNNTPINDFGQYTQHCAIFRNYKLNALINDWE